MTTIRNIFDFQGKPLTEVPTNQEIYSEDGKFLGKGIEELTDDLDGNNQEYYQKLKNSGPIGKWEFTPNALVSCPTTYYAQRTVFSKRFGCKVVQILTKCHFDDDMVWLNT
jgi:hypothetical protein